MEALQNKIIEKIKNGEELSPFLFVAKNQELLNKKVETLALNIFNYFKIPKINLIKLEDNGEKVKISEIKEFIKKSELKNPYWFQIFLIENISRFTLQAANACLKFFEEPGKQNIIFLTNSQEFWILETILSRVQIINLNKEVLFSKKEENQFYFNLLDNYLKNKNSEIFAYFFRNKLEKEELIDFLENLILYAKKNFVFLDLLEEIDEDINLIKSNNLNARGIVDKYLLSL